LLITFSKRRASEYNERSHSAFDLETCGEITLQHSFAAVAADPNHGINAGNAGGEITLKSLLNKSTCRTPNAERRTPKSSHRAVVFTHNLTSSLPVEVLLVGKPPAREPAVGAGVSTGLGAVGAASGPEGEGSGVMATGGGAAIAAAVDAKGGGRREPL